MCLEKLQFGSSHTWARRFFKIIHHIISWIPAELSINAGWNSKHLFSLSLQSFRSHSQSFTLSPNQLVCFNSLNRTFSLTHFKSTNWLIYFRTHSSPWVMVIFLLQPPNAFVFPIQYLCTCTYMQRRYAYISFLAIVFLARFFPLIMNNTWGKTKKLKSLLKKLWFNTVFVVVQVLLNMIGDHEFTFLITKSQQAAVRFRFWSAYTIYCIDTKMSIHTPPFKGLGLVIYIYI